MNKRTDNEYFLSYGLVKDPFPSRVIDRNIFLTPEINRRLKLIRQHINEGQKLLLVTSARGAGKSLLARKLLILKQPNWHISLTRAHENMNAESLAHSIVQQFQPEKNENISQSISMLHKYLEHSFHERVVPVIVIDDADLLSFDTLQFVLQLADLRYNEALFRIVLFANESITEILTKPGLKELAEDTVDIVSMPYFSREQIPAYLRSLFSSCGENVEPAFSESEYEYLYQASGGLPGGINMLTRQLMQDALKEDTPQRNYGRMTALLSVFLLALAGYLYYKSILLENSHVLSKKTIQQSPAVFFDTKNSMAGKTTAKSTAGKTGNGKARLSPLHEPLSLKLSDLLTEQSTQ